MVGRIYPRSPESKPCLARCRYSSPEVFESAMNLAALAGDLDSGLVRLESVLDLLRENAREDGARILLVD